MNDRQQVREWAKNRMEGQVFSSDKILFDQLLHSMVLDQHAGVFRCQYSVDSLGKTQQKRQCKALDRLAWCGVIDYAPAGNNLFIVYIPQEGGSRES